MGRVSVTYVCNSCGKEVTEWQTCLKVSSLCSDCYHSQQDNVCDTLLEDTTKEEVKISYIENTYNTIVSTLKSQDVDLSLYDLNIDTLIKNLNILNDIIGIMAIDNANVIEDDSSLSFLNSLTISILYLD